MNRGKHVSFLLLSGVIILSPDIILAGSVSAELMGNGVTALELDTIQMPDLGTIEKPTSTVHAIVSTAGATSGTATFLDTSTVRRGEYSVSGSDSNLVTITAVDNGTYADLSFDAITGTYGSTSNFDMIAGGANLDAPGTGITLYVGLNLKVNPTITEGNYSPAFTITVNYE